MGARGGGAVRTVIAGIERETKSSHTHLQIWKNNVKITIRRANT